MRESRMKVRFTFLALFVLMCNLTVVAQGSRKITGVVLDELKYPMVGVAVTTPSKGIGTVTDLDGQYQLQVPAGVNELVFSYLGYETQTVTIGKQSNVNVSLKPSSQALDEVVVVGYGTSAVKDITGSVATIGAKELGNLNVTSAASLLQNLATGVQVTQNTGRPGESVRVRVRGATSLTGSNEPLYVIDGIPADDASLLDAISPSDIQSMDVLKDASAAAIYGSRAANGVVIVTTKRGKAGQKPTIGFNYNSTFDTQIKNFRILEADEWRNYITGVAHNTLLVNPSNKTAKEVLDANSGIFGTHNTNWFDQVKQTAMRQNADFSVGGGTDAAKYMVALSVLDQQGMVIGDNMTRYNARMNLEMNILPIIRFGTNATFSYTDQQTSGTSLFSSQGFRPDLPIYNEDGSFNMVNNSANPVANTYKEDNRDTYRAMGTVYLEADIIKGLKFKTSLSGNFETSRRLQFSPSFLDNSKRASGSEYHYLSYKTVFDNVLSYNKTFNRMHSIDAVAGVSFESFEGRSTTIQANTYPQDEIFTNIGSASVISKASNGYNTRGLFSSFMRANYKLMDKYLFTFTGRYDGSSMFGTNNRYGFFPSGAVAWRISEESFMKGAKAVNDLKIRLSAGTTGTQNLTSFANRDLYAATDYRDLPALSHSQIGNRDIRWEKSTQYDAGIDFAFFDYRLTGSIGGYIKDTKDLIWNLDFPSSSAVGSMARNVGAVRNSGIEFNIVGRPIETDHQSLTLTFNMAHNRNRVTYLVSEGSQVNALGINIHGSSQQVLAQGYPMGSFFGYEYLGIIQSQLEVDALNAYAKLLGQQNYDGDALYPGMLAYKDLSGNGKIDDADRTILGSPDPAVFGGFTGTYRWKQVSVFANFGYQIGGKKVYGKTLQNIPNQLTGLIDYGLNDRWTPENPNAKYPAIYLEKGVERANIMQIHDASYLRLQELRVSYDLPKFGPLNGQVYVSSSNLFTITKYPGTDPATVNANSNYGGNYESSYPGIRSFSVGLKFNL